MQIEPMPPQGPVMADKRRELYELIERVLFAWHFLIMLISLGSAVLIGWASGLHGWPLVILLGVVGGVLRFLLEQVPVWIPNGTARRLLILQSVAHAEREHELRVIEYDRRNDIGRLT